MIGAADVDHACIVREQQSGLLVSINTARNGGLVEPEVFAPHILLIELQTKV